MSQHQSLKCSCADQDWLKSYPFQLRDQSKERVLAKRFYQAATAADPMGCLIPHLPEVSKGKLVIVGAGKASAMIVETAHPVPA